MLALAVAGCGDEPDPPYADRETLRAYLDQAPGVPLVLPTALPASFVFLGPGFEQGREGRLVVRTMDFRLDDDAASAVVELCVAEPGSPASTCVPPGSASRAAIRSSGAYPVWIRPLGQDVLTQGERRFWTTVPLTDDLDAVPWLT